MAMPKQYKAIYESFTGRYYLHLKGEYCKNFNETAVYFYTVEEMVAFMSKSHSGYVYIDELSKTIEPPKPKNRGHKRRIRKLIV
jgi:hypothetical protein